MIWIAAMNTHIKQTLIIYYRYNIVYFTLTYIVPITAMGICYGKISFVLWGKSTVRENATSDLVHQRKLIAKRKVMKYWRFDAVHYDNLVSFLPIFYLKYRTNIIFQVVKMFIAVVIVFAICWLPYHLYFIFTYHFNELTKSPMVQHVYLGFYWLAMSNSMFNPFVYYWMNSRYVHDIWLIFLFLKFQKLI